MSKQERNMYCKIGQAVCNLVGALMFVGIPILGCIATGYIANLI